MRIARHVLSLTLFAAVVCADRGAAVAPANAPRGESFVTAIAQRFARRFNSNLHAVVQRSPLCPVRSIAVAASQSGIASAKAPIVRRPLSPFAFRLPPPIV